MNLLDTRTVLFSYVISNAICAAVMASLWWHNRKRSPVLVFWLAEFIMQFAGVALIILRGRLPDFFSMVLSNILIVGGTLLLFIGLERYTRKSSPQWHNYIYLAAFAIFQLYFVFVQPSQQARNINVSLGVLVMCAQCAWLLLRRVDADMRPDMRDTGVALGLISLVSLVRVVVDMFVPSSHDLLKSGLYDTLSILLYQMLFISLTFALFLMVNRRLLSALEKDAAERKLADEALRVSDEKFSKAFQTAPYAISITRAEDGKFIEVNDAFTSMTGLSRQEALAGTGLGLNLWVNEQDRHTVVSSLLKGQTMTAQEFLFRKKNGEIITGLLSAQVIQLQQGLCILSSINDITERKQAEVALRDINERFRAIFEGHDAIMLLIEPQSGLILEANQAAANFYGYTQSKLCSMSIDDINILSPDEVAAERQKAASAKKNYFVFPHRLANGEERVVEVHSSPIMFQDKAVLFSIIHDVTERKRTEEALLHSEIALQRAQSVASVGSWKWHIKSNQLEWSDEMYHIFGIDKENFSGDLTEVIGRAIHPDDRAKVEQSNLSVSKDNKPIPLEYRIIWPDGTVRVVWGEAGEILLDEAGNSETLTGIVQDITGRKQVEDALQEYSIRLETEVEIRTLQLRQAQEQLVRQEKLAVLGQMASSVGHELRNPLGVINSAVYYLKLVLPNADEKVKQYLGMIAHEVRTSEKIIADLLDFARIKSVDRELVSVSELIRQTLERFPAPPSVEVLLDIPENLPQAFVDVLQITQVLGNLTVNACQAMPKSGQLSLSSRMQNDMINIQVKDNGVGIPPENIAKIFEPLFTTRTKGIGLGLAVSQKLIEANGGSIQVESEAGVGTTFTVRLPIRK